MGIEESDKRGNQARKMSERRKSSKPIMEKRRRERINNSLNELKNLLLESRKKDSTCCSKLEKADILEMTVQYLKSIRSHQEKASMATDPVALAHYRAGFNHSAMEISRYLIDTPDIEVKVRTRLLSYLSNSCHAVLNSQASIKQFYPSSVPPVYQTSISQTPELSTHSPNDTIYNPREPSPYFLNPTQLQLMSNPLTNGKITTALVPGPNLRSSPHEPKVLQARQLAPGSSTSTITHGQELLINSAEASPNSRTNNDTNSNSSTHSNSQSSSSDESNVWRPWS